jgi:hypothetical protein
MKRRRRSVIAVLTASLGIVGVFAIGPSSATAQEGSVDFFAYLDEGQSTAVVGVPGAFVGAACLTPNETIAIQLEGTASNGLSKANVGDEGGDDDVVSRDDLDTGETMPMNLFGPVGEEVSGHMEFVNGAGSRNLTAQYSTEGGADFAGIGSDCAVWGSAVKRFM